MFRRGAGLAIIFVLVAIAPPARADFVQQGGKLAGNDSAGTSNQGQSVALSADGNTALVGGQNDFSQGAAWVYVRSNGVWSQQGAKLAGTGATFGGAHQGNSVALSADGNTAILGGYADDGGVGAAWVFTRTGTTWSQQGQKLVGSNAVGASWQGYSVALSADGNTAIVGGYQDDAQNGAVWIFTRTAGVWSQQGPKLVADDAVGPAQQGWSVALSADGDTALVGGPNDGTFVGSTWVYTRSGAVWTRQTRLRATSSQVQQGKSVSLSADGNTAIIGATAENSGVGAAFVFTRTNGAWSAQASKLTGTGAVGNSTQGTAVSLSASGDKAIVAGSGDATALGAVWVFTRSGGVWTQQGAKLTGSGATAFPRFGHSAAISADGNTAIAGGYFDTNGIGAAWVFSQAGGPANDNYLGAFPLTGKKIVFPASNIAATKEAGEPSHGNNAGGKSVWWRWVAPRSGAVTISTIGSSFDTLLGVYVDTGTSLATIAQNDDIYSDTGFGRNLQSRVTFNATAGTTYHIAVDGFAGFSGAIVLNLSMGQALGRDLDGGARSDILWRHSAGATAVWFMNGASLTSGPLLANVDPSWTIAGTGDFNGDRKSDILWRHTSGATAMWLMNAATLMSGPLLPGVDTSWTIAGVGDFDGDGKSDILWRQSSGATAIWFMNGAALTSGPLVANVSPAWSIAGTGDFNGDGKSDVLWRGRNGEVSIWLMNGAAVTAGPQIAVVDPSWTIAAVGDFDGDGKGDILWRHTSGATAIWFMKGAALTSGPLIATVDPGWTIQRGGMN